MATFGFFSRKKCVYRISRTDREEHSIHYIKLGYGEENTAINYGHVNPVFVALEKKAIRSW
jgi:hypothetical protein